MSPALLQFFGFTGSPQVPRCLGSTARVLVDFLSQLGHCHTAAPPFRLSKLKYAPRSNIQPRFFPPLRIAHVTSIPPLDVGERKEKRRAESVGSFKILLSVWNLFFTAILLVFSKRATHSRNTGAGSFTFYQKFRDRLSCRNFVDLRAPS